jgi:hypothetical protein
MARALLRRSFTGQAITAVVFAYAALLPLRVAGWISTSTYTVAALLLSLAALAIVGNRLGRSVANLRSELTRLTTLNTQGGLSAYVASGIPTGAQDKLYRPVERRAQKPKVSSEAAENAASRNLAQQWTRSQRIARRQLGMATFEQRGDLLSRSVPHRRSESGAVSSPSAFDAQPRSP